MEPIQKEHERLCKKSNLLKVVSQVDNLLNILTATRKQIDPAVSGDLNLPLTLAKFSSQVSTAINNINEEHQEVYKSQSKYGKALEKKFKVSNSFLGPEYDALSSETALINRAIAMHLIREGNFGVARTFMDEAREKGEELDVKEELMGGFEELFSILEAMKEPRRDLGPAMRWARERGDLLEARGSNLEFELYRLQYIWLFMGEGKKDGIIGDMRAFEFARREFGRFQGKYLREIQQLMTAFVFLPTLALSPYAPLFLSPEALWSTVSHSLTKEFCSLLNLSAESPLYIAATAGTIALPTLLKMASIMKEKKTEWSTVNELPVEIPLPPNYQFHSIFVCPVSKDQTTEDNPPMMLPCGHVIAEESLQRLAKGGGQNAIIKCPYCPRECQAGQAKRVYL